MVRVLAVEDRDVRTIGRTILQLKCNDVPLTTPAVVCYDVDGLLLSWFVCKKLDILQEMFCVPLPHNVMVSVRGNSSPERQTPRRIRGRIQRVGTLKNHEVLPEHTPPQPDDRDPGGCSNFHPGNLGNRVYGLLVCRLHLEFPHPQPAPSYPSLDTFSSLYR